MTDRSVSTENETETNSIRVLHVDDDPGVLSATENYFERFEETITVETTTDPTSVVSRVESEPVECILCDYEMPTKDGLDVLETVRDAGLTQPFILYTGKGSENVASEAISAGVTDYIRKGDSVDHFAVLANRIENAVTLYRSERRREVLAASDDGSGEYHDDPPAEGATKKQSGSAADEGATKKQSGSAADDTAPDESDHGLETYETRLGGTLERVDDAFFALDEDWQVTYVNDAGAAVLRDAMDADYGIEELLGRNLWDEVPEAVDTPFYDHYHEAMETQEQVSFEAHYEPLSTWFEARVYPDDDGLSVYFSDVTERKRHEQHLEAYERALNAAVDMVYQLDTDGNLTMVNDAWVERTGYDREELLGEHISIIMNDEAVERGRRYVREAVADGADQTVSLDFEVQTADGETFPAESRIAIRRVNGEFAGTIGVTRDVSDRQQRQRELERFEGVVNVVDDCVYALDDEGQFELVNDELVTLTGYSRDELLGEHVGMIKDEATVEQGEQELAELLSGGDGETTFEMRLQASDRADIPCEDHMTVRYDEDGEFVGTAGVIRDITTQKRRREKLESLVETTQELMQARTETAVVETTIEAASEALGFEMGTVRLYDDGTERLEPVAQISPPDGARHERPAYDVGEFPTGEVFETGEPLVRQNLSTDPDSGDANAGLYVPIGEYGTLSMGASEPDAFDELDRQVASVLATSAATALERVEREQQVRRERNRVGALFETVPEPIAHVRFEDGAPIVQTANDAFTDVFGYEESEIVGENLNDHIVPEHDRDTGREIDARADEQQPVEREVQRLASDGERDFLFRSVPLPEQDWSDTTESIGVYVDITEQKETERELQRQNERLERFASTVSHDLRNPLKIAKSHLDMATHECESDLLDDVAAAHDRMEELIEDLLAMARGGQAVEETEPLSLEDVAREAWESVEMEAATFEGIDGDSAEADAVFVEADRARLLQVFENLFRNAVEHGRADVTVGIEATADGFAVVDDGSGIPDDEHEAVFEYGYTTADTGTGFGLAIVQEIVNAHGWTVSLADTDTGTRFEFET